VLTDPLAKTLPAGVILSKLTPAIFQSAKLPFHGLGKFMPIMVPVVAQSVAAAVPAGCINQWGVVVVPLDPM
jgi:hypothetical protein